MKKSQNVGTKSAFTPFFLFIYLLFLLLVDVFSGFDITPHRKISNVVDYC